MGRRCRRVLALAALPVAGCGGAGAAVGSATAGRHVFTTAGCPSCHTLSAVGARGAIGPNFDTSERLTRGQIRARLTAGVGGMPSFAGRLTPRQLDDVTEFLYEATHRPH